jgi:hypothetical protein
MLYPRALNCNLGHNVGRHGQWLELWLKHLIYWWNNMSLIKFEGFDFYWMFCKLPWTLMWNLWFRIEDFIWLDGCRRGEIFCPIIIFCFKFFNVRKHHYYKNIVFTLLASCLKWLYSQYLEHTNSLKWLNVSIMTKIKSSNVHYD